MPSQDIINLLIAAVGALIGWILKGIWEAINDLKADHKALREADAELIDKVSKIELLVVGDYVKHDDFKEFGNAIFAKLDKIYDALGKKADK
jgi:hypothetical protein